MFLSMNVQNLGGKAVITALVQQPPRKIVKVVSRICLYEERIGDHEFFYDGLYKYLQTHYFKRFLRGMPKT